MPIKYDQDAEGPGDPAGMTPKTQHKLIRQAVVDEIRELKGNVSQADLRVH